MLRIYLAGDVWIEHAGRAVAGDRLPGLQGRVVLALLAASDGAVSRDDLVEELWGDAPPASAATTLRALISKVRGALEEASLDGRILARELDGYRLRPPRDAWVDVVAAADAVHRAEPALRAGDLSSAVGWARVASAIASRPLLPGAEGPWVRARREDLVAIAVRAWECLAAAWIRTGDPGQAVRDADRALVVDPYREPALRLMMRALADAGDRAGALRAYERFRRRVADELGADPSPQTQALHVEILRGERSIADA